MSNVSGIGAPTPEPIQPRKIEPQSRAKEALQNILDHLKDLATYASEHHDTITKQQYNAFLDQLKKLPQDKTQVL